MPLIGTSLAALAPGGYDDATHPFPAFPRRTFQTREKEKERPIKNIYLSLRWKSKWCAHEYILSR